MALFPEAVTDEYSRMYREVEAERRQLAGLPFDDFIDLY
jgi:hypothetical protein